MAANQYFQIATCHGGLLAAAGAAGTVVSCSPALLSSVRPSLILFSTPANPNAHFLCTLTDELRPITLMPEPDAYPVLALRATSSPTGYPVRLLVPASGMWLCGIPGPEDGTGPVVADKSVAQAWEHFTLLPLDPATIPPWIKTLSDEAAWLLDADAAFTGILDRIDRPFFLDALSAVSQVVSTDRLLTLASSIASSSAAVERLASRWPEDVFATVALPSIAAARKGERLSGSGASLGNEFDRLATLGFDGRPTSLAHRITIALREDVRPTKDVCILATARNEGLHILDWVAYHRSIGVEDVFLYTNDNDDGSDALLSALDASGVIRWRNSLISTGGNAQQKAYGHGLQVLTEILDYKWALVIDLDEYFGFDPTMFSGIIDFLEWQSINEADAVAMNWMIHGSAGQSRWRDAFVAERFAVAQHPPDMHIKCAIRPHRFIHSRPHHPIGLRRSVRNFRAATGGAYKPAPDRNEMSLTLEPTADKAWISHFYYKSTEEFILKWSRNQGDSPTGPGVSNLLISEHLIRSFMAQYSIKEPNNNSILPCAPNFQEKLGQMRSLPGVREAFETIVARHKERMPGIEKLFQVAPGVIAAGEVGEAFLATLQT